MQELIKKSLVHVLLSVCDIEVTLECEAMRIFPSYNILETRECSVFVNTTVEPPLKWFEM